MKISVLTILPEMYTLLNSSIIGRALQNNAFEVQVIDIREYSTDKHKKCDDSPFGGGAGMVMTPQPIHDAIMAIDPEHLAYRIYLSPKGSILNQKKVLELSSIEHILLVSGCYEGIDERIIQLDIDAELSIGDYVLMSGDLASLVVINTVARYLPNVLGSEESTQEESFSNGLLEYPHYTRPRDFMGLKVPDVLLSGNHEKIKVWRQSESLR
ncbi:MAG: tRNA (guanosine(37)-N1)-methyltransferase TrmD, partial [Christensenellaceae bacterium]|nr:tRNA (guanosine(37)-N1)-methyltransferase TrmD [Christensenellaceae bacterium]